MNADLKEPLIPSKLRANPARYMNKIPFFAAIIAFLGVALGAFGAHGLKDLLLEKGTTGTWETAVFYHLIHAVAAWSAGIGSGQEGNLTFRAAWCWMVGVVIFSGSLYLLAIGGPRWLGPITPIGGLLFLTGWTFAARAAWLSGHAKSQ